VNDDLDRRKQLARDVLRSLDGIEASAIRMLAGGLSLVPAPLNELAQPLDYHADAVEHEDVSGDLATLRTARALRLIARHPECPELIERLEGLDAPLWASLRGALVADQARFPG
jgi:hypothetical protein